MESHITLPQKIVVVGVGNELLSDEGLGVHVAKALQKMDIPPEIEVVEGGTDGFALMPIIMETDLLYLIDSIKGGSEPGTIYKFNIKNAPACMDLYKTSVHQIGILEVIRLTSLVGKSPETTIIGMEPKSISLGMDLSPEIKAKIPRIIDLVLKELNDALNHFQFPS